MAENGKDVNQSKASNKDDDVNGLIKYNHKNTDEMLEASNGLFDEPIDEIVDTLPRLLSQEPNGSKDSNANLTDDGLRKNDDPNNSSKDGHEDNDEISRNIEQLFNDLVNEDKTFTQLVTQQIDVLKSEPESVKDANKNIINHSEGYYPDSQDVDKIPVNNMKNTSSDNADPDKECREADFCDMHSGREKHTDLGNQGSCGYETNAKLEEVFDSFDTYDIYMREQFTFLDGDTMQGLEVEELEPSIHFGDNEANEILEACYDGRLFGFNANRSSSTSSTPFEDLYIPNDISKLCKDDYEITSAGQIAIDIDNDENLIVEESEKDSLIDSKYSDFSDNEDMSFEGLMKIADQFSLTEDVKKSIFGEESKRKKSTSDDNDSDSSVENKMNIRMEKYKKAKNDILNIIGKSSSKIKIPKNPGKVSELINKNANTSQDLLIDHINLSMSPPPDEDSQEKQLNGNLDQSVQIDKDMGIVSPSLSQELDVLNSYLVAENLIDNDESNSFHH